MAVRHYTSLHTNIQCLPSLNHMEMTAGCSRINTHQPGLFWLQDTLQRLINPMTQASSFLCSKSKDLCYSGKARCCVTMQYMIWLFVKRIKTEFKSNWCDHNNRPQQSISSSFKVREQPLAADCVNCSVPSRQPPITTHCLHAITVISSAV